MDRSRCPAAGQMSGASNADMDEIDARLGDALFGLRSWRDGVALDASLGPQQSLSDEPDTPAAKHVTSDAAKLASPSTPVGDISGTSVTVVSPITESNSLSSSSLKKSSTGLQVKDLVVVKAHVPRVKELNGSNEVSPTGELDKQDSKTAEEHGISTDRATEQSISPETSPETTRQWQQRARFLRRRESRAKARARAKNSRHSGSDFRKLSLTSASFSKSRCASKHPASNRQRAKHINHRVPKKERPIIAIIDGMLVREPGVDKHSKAKAAELLRKRHEEEQLSSKRKRAARARLQRLQKQHAREQVIHRQVQERIASEREARKVEAWEMKQLLLLRRSEKAAARHRGIARRVDRDQSARQAAAMRRRLELQEKESRRLEEMARRFSRDADLAFVSVEHQDRLGMESVKLAESDLSNASSQPANAAGDSFRSSRSLGTRKKRKKNRKRGFLHNGSGTKQNYLRKEFAPNSLRQQRPSTRMQRNAERESNIRSRQNFSFDFDRSERTNINNVSAVGTAGGNKSMSMSMSRARSSSFAQANHSRWERTKRQAEARRAVSDLKAEEIAQRKSLAKQFAREKMQLRRAKEELEALRRGVEAQRKMKKQPEEAHQDDGDHNDAPQDMINASDIERKSTPDLEVSEASRRMAKELRKMEKLVESEKRKRKSMQNEIKAARRLARSEARASSSQTHITHHPEGVAWVPSSSATPLVGESGVASSLQGVERWRRVQAAAEKRRLETEATRVMARRRKELIEQLKAEKRRQRKIESEAVDIAKIQKNVDSCSKQPPAPSSMQAAVLLAPPPQQKPQTAKPRHNVRKPHALDIMLKKELRQVISRERDKLRKPYESAPDGKTIADEVESRIRDIVIEKATAAALAAVRSKVDEAKRGQAATTVEQKRRRRSKKRPTKPISPKLGLSRAERIKAQKLREAAHAQKKKKLISEGTQSTPSLARRVKTLGSGKVDTFNSPVPSSAGSELDQTGDTSMGFDEDFQTAGGWEELQELLAFHSPASVLQKSSKLSSTGKKKSVKKMKKKRANTNKKKQNQQSSTTHATLLEIRKNQGQPEMKVTQITYGVQAPAKTSSRSNETSEKTDEGEQKIFEKRSLIGSDSILGLGVDFDKRIEEQRRQFDEERQAFEERLKALQSGAVSKEKTPAETKASFDHAGGNSGGNSGEKSTEEDADNEADSSMDASVADVGASVTNSDKDASDLMWMNDRGDSPKQSSQLNETKSTNDIHPEAHSSRFTGKSDGSDSPGASSTSQGSPASNDENIDLSRVNTNEASRRSKGKKRKVKPFSTPPRSNSIKAPLSSPPPSLFKTDIVDRVVEQHASRDTSSVSTLLSFVSSDSDEHDSEQVSVEF